MGESATYQSIGRVDSEGRRGAAAAPANGREKGSGEGAKSHGDIVVEAISGPMRVLMAGVIVVNLTLGAWWIQRSDFSEVRPQGTTEEAPATPLEVSPETLPQSGQPLLNDLPMAAAKSRLETADRSAMFALNDRE